MLKYFVEKIEDVDESLREHYNKSDIPDKPGYMLEVGDLPNPSESQDVSTLELTLKKERSERKKFQQELKKFKDVDPVQFKELLQASLNVEKEKKKLERKNAEKKGEYEVLVKQLQEEHDTALNTLKTQHADFSKAEAQKKAELLMSLEKHMIGEGIARSLARTSVQGNVELLSPHIKQHLKLKHSSEDGTYAVNVVNEAGETRYIKGIPMTVDDLVDEFKSNPSFQGDGIFKQEKSPSGAAPSGSTSIVGTAISEALTPQQYMEGLFNPTSK